MSELNVIFVLAAAPFVGSFLGLVADRLPAGRSIISPRSACGLCAHRLAARDLVPVVSWIVNRGRCRFCQGAVPSRYLWIELAALGIAVWSALVLSGWLLWATVGLGWALLTLALIDRRHFYLPDQITLPLILAGLGVIYAIDPGRVFDHALGAAAGFLLVWILRLAYFRLRGEEGIGLGDAKLLAAAGAWVSWQGLPSVILIAAGAALSVLLAKSLLTHQTIDKTKKSAFGPYLAVSFWLIWLYGPLSLQ